MKGTIDLLFDVANENGKPQKNVAVKNNAPFGSCISKINNTLTDNAEDPDTVMPMYNLLECSQNHSMTSGSCQPTLNYEVTIPLKYLCSFGYFLIYY